MPNLRFCYYIVPEVLPTHLVEIDGWNGAFQWHLHTQLLPTEGHSSCSKVFLWFLSYSPIHVLEHRVSVSSHAEAFRKILSTKKTVTPGSL